MDSRLVRVSPPMPTIDTIIVIHLSSDWPDTNYRYAFTSLAEELPDHVATICVNRPIDVIVAPIRHTASFLSGFWRTRVERVMERLLVLTPRVFVHELLAAHSSLITAQNVRAMRRALRRILDEHFPDTKRIIQWVHHPHQQWVCDAFPDGGSVYLCYDEYACTPDGVFQDDRWSAEALLLRSADVTFVVNESVGRRRAADARRLELMDNGIPDFFLADRQPASDPIDAIPEPRIVYLGQLYSFLDSQLLASVFAAHPEWQLVMIGASNNRPASLRRLPNVHFVGRRPHETLPSILPKCRAGLLPFKINDYSAASNFLKLYAYWAAGLPVVSTKLPQFKPHEHHLRFSSADPVSFAEAILEVLSQDRESVARIQRNKAREFTWTKINREHVVPVLREVFGF